MLLSAVLTVISLIAGGKAIVAAYRKELDYAIALAILCCLCGGIALAFLCVFYTEIWTWSI